MSVVLALDAYASDLSVERAVLAPLGTDVALASADPHRRAHQLRDAVGLLVVDTPVDAGTLAVAPRCRVVATYGIGVDNIDLPAARAAGVVVANVPDYCQDEVAEHTLALWLAVERRIVRGDAMVRHGRWEARTSERMRRLRGLTWGLVGFGRIARQVALRARGFGLSVLAVDPAVNQIDAELAFVRLVADLPTLLASSDVVSLHVPLTSDTRHLLDAAALARMRPAAVLLNTARGGLVDQAALMDALRSGALGGAGLDVLETEPPPLPLDIPGSERLVLTPHVAFRSGEAIEAARRGAAGAVASVLRGEPVANRVA